MIAETKTLPRRMITRDETIQSPLDPIAFLYERLTPLQTVEAIYADWHPDGFEVWLVANQTTVADRELIYDQEWALMQKFPQLGFDFRLIDRSQSDTTISLDDADFSLRLPHGVYA